MMNVVMINLYSKSTIKSGVFLFPLIGTSRYSEFPHRRTYIVYKEKGITEKSRKLIVSYPRLVDANFITYERKVLSGNKYFDDFFETDNEYFYIFNLTELKKDWDLFLDGKYSKLSSDVKKRIMAYHIIAEGRAKKENRTMQEILYPFNPTQTELKGKTIEFKDAFERHAPSLDISAQIMREIGEIYSKPDLRSEELVLERV